MARLLRAKIEELEKRLSDESALLDKMAYHHPKTYMDVSRRDDGLILWRPGVAILEMREAMRAPNPS